MKKQAYQKPTIYNSDGTKAQTGTFDIRTDPLTNSTADGILDYYNNNLEALKAQADNGDTTDSNLRYDVDKKVNRSGDAMTGQLKINTASDTVPLNILTPGTNHADIQIASSDGNHRIAVIRTTKTSEGRCEITIGASTTSNAAPGGITISRSTTDIYATAPTPDATDNSTKIATTAFVRSIIPAGIVQAFAGSTTPQGWLLCDGSAVSRTDYAALYAVIGTTYGAGNGSTTFNLPNLVDKFVEGSATAGTVKSAGLPNITGSAPVSGYGWKDWNDNQNGALSIRVKILSDRTPPGSGQQNSWGDTILNIDASSSNSIYGKSTTVQPPALTMRYIIKY